MVGRGPRDQSGGEKWCREAREALPHPAPLRFERANGREAGRGWIAAFTTEFPSETIFRGGSGCVLLLSRRSRVMVTLSEKMRRGHFNIFAPQVGDGGRKVEKKKKVENDESSLPPLLSSNLGA